jgi:large subunit ribosomal protein L1
MKLTKNRKAVLSKIQKGKLYSIEEASALVKEVTRLKFDASIDLHVRLGIDPKKADQAIRGTVSLPHGTGKTKTVLVLCTPDKVDEALAAGADYAGLDEYIEKVNGGWIDFDVVIATPAVMPKIARLGKVLGPRNLMPNPKSGTVTTEVAAAVQEVKKGKIAFKVDKSGIVHASVGRVSFDAKKIADNAKELLQTIVRLKPSSAKGQYLKSITMVSTMGPGIAIDPKTISAN